MTLAGDHIRFHHGGVIVSLGHHFRRGEGAMTDQEYPEGAWRECPQATEIAQSLNQVMIVECLKNGYSSEDMLFGVIFYLAQIMGTLEVEPDQIWETLAANVEVYKKLARNEPNPLSGQVGVQTSDPEVKH